MILSFDVVKSPHFSVVNFVYLFVVLITKLTVLKQKDDLQLTYILLKF